MLRQKTADLVKASSSGHIREIRTLLTLKADINAVHLGGTAIWHAVSHNQFETIKYLLEQGADVNIMDPQMSSPLYKEVHNNNFEIVEYLLQKGANVDKGTSDLTPLYFGVQGNNIQMMDLLLEYGANANIGNPLSQACLNRNAEALVLLLDNGATVSKNDVEEFLKVRHYASVMQEFVAQVTYCPPIRAISLWKLRVEYEKVTSRNARRTVNVLDRALYELSKVILPFYAKGVSQAIVARKIISEYDLMILSQISTIYPPYKKILKPILQTFQDLYMLKQIHDDSVSVLDATNTTLAASLVLNERCQKN